jgi:hypothetical protein
MPTRKAGIEDCCRILSGLSTKFTEAKDGRRFGINVAYHAMCAFRDRKAKTVAEAIAMCEPTFQPPPPPED